MIYDAKHLKFAASVLDRKTYFWPAELFLFFTVQIAHILLIWPSVKYKTVIDNKVYNAIKEHIPQTFYIKYL